MKSGHIFLSKHNFLTQKFPPVHQAGSRCDHRGSSERYHKVAPCSSSYRRGSEVRERRGGDGGIKLQTLPKRANQRHWLGAGRPLLAKKGPIVARHKPNNVRVGSGACVLYTPQGSSAGICVWMKWARSGWVLNFGVYVRGWISPPIVIWTSPANRSPTFRN